MNIFNILNPTITIPSLILLLIIFSYIGVPLWFWTIYLGLILAWLSVSIWIWVIFIIVALVFNISQLRTMVITVNIVRVIKALNILPKISDTEREAIEAGTVWIEAEFFSGKPNFERMNQELYPQVSPEVQSFLDHQVEKVCAMATDWEIYQEKDLPPQVWDYLKQERFFGMMIPKEYGGLGFTSLAYSAVMTKLASRSFTYLATVGVTNSLGPAKLILRYGTPAQKNYYLPRLATGEEIPCFALTEPNAGSDAASITSQGVIFKGEDHQLYLRLNWRKRYITLGAIATLLGLAFRLYDPENWLGLGEDVGITCALIPTNIEGVILNQRHEPMGVPFYNSPTEGHSVIVPIEQIIGGVAGAGQGWRMLMQSLAAGRGISFPATSAGVAQLVTRVTGAYSVIRQQFGLSIGRFQGIEEPLARIGGLTYMVEALRLYTCGAVEKGEQPAVVSAIAKYHSTELARKIILDGMDVMAGAGICRGPRNLLANIYTAMPIAITVEGANILTRTLMIFGQGVIRCHPYVYQEINALNTGDLTLFDQALWGHLAMMGRNFTRALLLNLTRGLLAKSPVSGATAPYYRKLAWASATFACLTDIALIKFAGNLKRQEKLSGRFADLLSWMYIATATLRRFHAEGQPKEDLTLVDWSLTYAFAQMQLAIAGIFSNMPLPLSWWWRLNPIGAMPNDQLGAKVAKLLQKPSFQRDRLTHSIYIPQDPNQSLGRIELAFHMVSKAEPLLKKIKLASQNGQLPPDKPHNLLENALKSQIITQEEFNLLRTAETLRQDAIQVDAFSFAEYSAKNLWGRQAGMIGHNDS
jgi:acyl-CoA dehydrogenase